MKTFRELNFNSPYTAPSVEIMDKKGTAIGILKEGQELMTSLMRLVQNRINFRFEDSGVYLCLHVDTSIEEILSVFREWHNFESYGY